jgi:GT2 family glycosyltransferase
MSKFAFVILHYSVFNETIDCVDSICKKAGADDYNIIIVDNGSANKTGQQLQSTYKDNPKVTVLLNEKNLGFANGNNTGFKYAKMHFNPDFILLLNNDTLIIQDNFCELIQKEYNYSEFAVLGPQIHGPHGISEQNPGKSYIIRGIKLWKMTVQMFLKLFLAKLYLDFLIDSIQRIKQKARETRPKEDRTAQRCTDVILHGCCLIFSRKFIEQFDGLDPRTFMYMEEEILYLHLKSKVLLSVYNPEIKIYHLDDSSTNAVYSKPHRKKLFLYSNSLKSLFVYRKILKENGL